MQDFRNLTVWQKAHALSLDVHRTLARGRRIDTHLRTQIIRAARSIAANLVEGCGKASQAELARFADMAIGSCSELEYWLITARDLDGLAVADYERLTANTIEVRKMTFGLRSAVRGGRKTGNASSTVSASSDGAPP